MSSEKYTQKEHTLKRITNAEKLLLNILNVIADIRQNIPATTACKKHNINIRKFNHLLDYANHLPNNSGYNDTKVPLEHLMTPQEVIYNKLTGNNDITKIPACVNKTIPLVMRQPLTTREQSLLIEKYFKNTPPHELVEMFGVSRERLHQIEGKIFRELRRPKYMNQICFGLDYNKKLAKVRQQAFTEKWAELEQQAINCGALQAEKEITEHIKQTAVETQQQLRAAAITPDKVNILAMSIDELELSPRACNALARAGLKTVGDITERTDEQIFRIRNSGIKTFNEIASKLHQYGLTFALKEK